MPSGGVHPISYVGGGAMAGAGFGRAPRTLFLAHPAGTIRTGRAFLKTERVGKELLMSSLIIRSSRPHSSILPRPHTDANQRFNTYGPVQPMEQPSFLERLLFGRR